MAYANPSLWKLLPTAFLVFFIYLHHFFSLPFTIPFTIPFTSPHFPSPSPNILTIFFFYNILFFNPYFYSSFLILSSSLPSSIFISPPPLPSPSLFSLLPLLPLFPPFFPPCPSSPSPCFTPPSSLYSSSFFPFLDLPCLHKAPVWRTQIRVVHPWCRAKRTSPTTWRLWDWRQGSR